MVMPPLIGPFFAPCIDEGARLSFYEKDVPYYATYRDFSCCEYCVGSRLVDGVERPIAVSEYLVERMIAAGAAQICMMISPE